ncbi:hypothetical protein XENORESO_002397 [Xenotaenia resolanae]|uniref:Uncharacterized protein n=1 Tax=Xenotaenia resolanae TaxID=208358 RepID=A0ABV0WKU9_9TELE
MENSHMRLDSGIPLSSAGMQEPKEAEERRGAGIRDADVLQERPKSEHLPLPFCVGGTAGLLLLPPSLSSAVFSDATLVKGHSAPLFYTSGHLSGQESLKAD